MDKNTGGKKRILVVDDEIIINHICRAVLESQGFDVDTVTDCRTAQEMIDADHYDLCLLDVMIPEMSGQQLYQWLLKKHPPLAKKVVFSTGLAIEGKIERFLKNSHRPLLPKPFSSGELLNIVQRTLR